ncbi:MAG: hypothetical protein WBP63_07040, partial [Silvibacterium sp.]
VVNAVSKSEQLFALSANAIQRWVSANRLVESTTLVRLLYGASAEIFVMANHSDEPIAGTYLMSRQRVAAIKIEIENELDRRPREM